MEYLDIGDVSNAYASFMSDMGKHPDTEGHPALQLGMVFLMTWNVDDARTYINGFN